MLNVDMQAALMAMRGIRVLSTDGIVEELIEQAEGITRSPHFLREVILNCHRKGQGVDEIVRRTGLARDEIELILAREAMQAGENRTETS